MSPRTVQCLVLLSLCASLFFLTLTSANNAVAPHRPAFRPIARLRGGGKPSHAAPLPIRPEGSSASPPSEEAVAIIKFSINYGLDNGVMAISGPTEAFGSDSFERAVKMKKTSGERWEATVKVPLSSEVVEYRYIVMSGTWREEAKIFRRGLSLVGMEDGDEVEVQDSFRSAKHTTLASTAFTKAIFGRGNTEATAGTENLLVKRENLMWPKQKTTKESTVRISAFAPRIQAGHSLWMRGDKDALGAWSKDKMVPMVHTGGRVYVAQVTLPATDLPFEYNMVILDESGNALCEEKEGHKVSAVVAGSKRVVTDTTFNYPDPTYKTAGVAVPVSGIKTRMSTGIGEFLDMKLLADWCEKTGLQMIQILPINDSGDDPSPYSASSSFALHPSYVRPLTVTEYYEKLVDLDASGLKGWATSLIDQLNKNWRIDYPRVLSEKHKLMDAIFDAVGKDAVQADPGFQAWLKSSESWVHTYAAFKVQLAREKAFNNKWHDCTQWSKGQSEVQSIVNPAGQDYDQVLRVYFMQYHLHLQLLESSKYAEQKGIAIKGDIPIGVSRCSADVWAEPNLFKLNMNCGAPGDPEQNWGFPPYNWPEMHRDGCGWWKRRLRHMDQYFHAYRIDHVLGFFRMWEIPVHGNGGGGAYYPTSGLREAGLRNLRAIQGASDMLICGEDLGNVPDEVPPVLLELGVLGLRIQRWCDGQTWKYPYLTVGASSCHDCSPCRLWWNEEWGGAEGWYNFFIGKGSCPGGPPDWISQKIIEMHCEGSSMLTINPIQDYIDMWEKLRSKNPKNDMINKPGTTDGCWVYRCHISVEDLLKEGNFCDFVKNMMKKTNRGKVY